MNELNELNESLNDLNDLNDLNQSSIVFSLSTSFLFHFVVSFTSRR